MPIQSPNFLFIMDDQHRFDYLGCAEAEFVQTPNIDRLARRGIHFIRCYTNAPLCAPARIGLATGQHPTRLRSTSTACYLPPYLPTYYQRFRDHGYRVGCVGKLDLAKPNPYNGRYGDRPQCYQWGFTHPEECEGKMHAGAAKSDALLGPYSHFLAQRGLLEAFCEDYRARSQKGYVLGASHDSVLPTDAFEDVYIGQRAARWIEWVPDDFPWHLFVSFVGPHDPFDPPTEYADRYRDTAVPPPIEAASSSKPAWIQAKQQRWLATPGQVEQARRQYCALIELIDDQVGQLIAALEHRGMLENTFVIFASDHGEMLGDHSLFQKSVAYEPAIHVPLIVAGPGIEEGQVSDTFIQLIDVNPTICELAGLPSQPGIDASSFTSVLEQPSAEHREYIDSALGNFRCVRTNEYKFIDNYNDRPELYDLQDDPYELENIASENSELIAAFRRLL